MKFRLKTGKKYVKATVERCGDVVILFHNDCGELHYESTVTLNYATLSTGQIDLAVTGVSPDYYAYVKVFSTRPGKTAIASDSNKSGTRVRTQGENMEDHLIQLVEAFVTDYYGNTFSKQSTRKLVRKLYETFHTPVNCSSYYSVD